MAGIAYGFYPPLIYSHEKDRYRKNCSSTSRRSSYCCIHNISCAAESKLPKPCERNTKIREGARRKSEVDNFPYHFEVRHDPALGHPGTLWHRSGARKVERQGMLVASSMPWTRKIMTHWSPRSTTRTGSSRNWERRSPRSSDGVTVFSNP